MINAESGQRGRRQCPRCGRTYGEPGITRCPECGLLLTSENGRQEASAERRLKVRIAPLLREALASAGPGEDFDEALLRVLKARHPEDAAALLSACTRLIEMEARRANEDKSRTIRRLEESEPGPEIVLKTSGGEVPRITAESRIIHIGDKEYHSLEEVPPHLRHILEKGMPRGRASYRVGCSWALIGWIISLFRMAGK